MAIKVYTAQIALAAVKANPNGIIVAEKKKEDKVFKGTRFLNMRYNIGADVRKEGWFSVENILLSDGVADPNNEKDPRNEFEGVRLQLQTKLSTAGDFGQFLMLLNAPWRQTVASLAESGTINIGNRKIHDLLQLTLSENNEKNPGALIDDPIIRFKMDFKPFPATYPITFLRGLPKTQIFDYRTEYLDERGIPQYKPAMVTDPNTGKDVPVTEKNVHLFITAGSILRKGRIMMTSLAISQSWISHPIHINRAIIEPGPPAGFSDEVSVQTESDNAGVSSAFAPIVCAEPPTIVCAEQPTPIATQAEPQDTNTFMASHDEINNILDGL